jgi:hypothetical protein
MIAPERSRKTPSRYGWAPADPLRRPVLFVNPTSGGGTAVRAGVAERARKRGIEVIVLSPAQNLAAVVGEVVARGADALGTWDPPLRFTIRPNALRVRIALGERGASPDSLNTPVTLRTILGLARLLASWSGGIRDHGIAGKT